MSFDDDVDATTELFQRVALQNRLPELPHIGECHNCSEPLSEGVYCDSDCRADHENRVGAALGLFYGRTE